jgi:hypothetical protein
MADLAAGPRWVTTNSPNLLMRSDHTPNRARFMRRGANHHIRPLNAVVTIRWTVSATLGPDRPYLSSRN